MRAPTAGIAAQEPPVRKEMTKRNLFACGLAKAYWVYSIPVRANPVKLMLLVLKAVSAAM